MAISSASIAPSDSAPARFHYDPALAAFPDGRLAVAWLSLDGKAERLMAAIVADGIVGPAREIAATNGGYLAPAIAALPDGRALVVWPAESGGTFRLLGAVLDGEGNVLRRDVLRADERVLTVRIAVGPDGGARIARESIAAERTTVLVAHWEDGRLGDGEDVGIPGANAYDPAIAFDGEGALWIAFSAFAGDFYDVYARSCDGGSWTEPVSLSWQTESSIHPAIAGDPVSGAWVAWESYTGPRRSEDTEPLVQHPTRLRQLAFWDRQRRSTLVHVGKSGLAVPFRGSREQTARESPLLEKLPPDAAHPTPIVAADGTLRVVALHYARIRPYPDYSGAIPLRARPIGLAFAAGDWRPIEVADPALPGGEMRAVPAVSLPDGRTAVATIVDLRPHREQGALDGTVGVRVWFVDPVADVVRPTLAPRRNPVVARPPAASPPTGGETEQDGIRYRLVFGNLHRHSDLSVCLRGTNLAPPVHFRAARDMTGESFGALTDHDVNSDAYHWHENLTYARLYHFPSAFVTVPSYEWTASQIRWDGGPFGHLNVHFFSDEDAAALWCAFDRESGGTPERLFGHLDDRALAIPHHPLDRQHRFIWEFHDERFSPVVEIFQDYRGSGEYPGTPGTTSYGQAGAEHAVRTALAAGHRVGFVGGGDHFGVALAGVWIRELSRDGIREALRARRCFATTGGRIRVLFSAGGAFMGGEVEAGERRARRRIAWEVAGAASVMEVAIVRNGVEIHVERGESAASGEYDDRDPASEISDAFAVDGRPTVCYYLRAILADGEMAWASPVRVAL